jgi:hypothetical protein
MALNLNSLIINDPNKSSVARRMKEKVQRRHNSGIDYAEQLKSTEQLAQQPVQPTNIPQMQPAVIQQSGLGDSAILSKLQELNDIQSQRISALEQYQAQSPYGQFNEGDGGFLVDQLNATPDDKKFLSALGKVESNNNYYLKPNSSGYEGKYQMRFRKGDDGYKYIQKMGVSVDQWRKSPELQEKMMGMVLQDYKKQLRSKGLPVNNYTLWLRHNQGLGGARAILSGKLTPLIRRNIRNQGVSGDSDSALIANYHKKFRHKF